MKKQLVVHTHFIDQIDKTALLGIMVKNYISRETMVYVNDIYTGVRWLFAPNDTSLSLPSYFRYIPLIIRCKQIAGIIDTSIDCGRLKSRFQHNFERPWIRNVQISYIGITRVAIVARKYGRESARAFIIFGVQWVCACALYRAIFMTFMHLGAVCACTKKVATHPLVV